MISKMLIYFEDTLLDKTFSFGSTCQNSMYWMTIITIYIAQTNLPSNYGILEYHSSKKRETIPKDKGYCLKIITSNIHFRCVCEAR